MSCNCSKDCDCHQNSSFSAGLFFGLIIGAVVAIYIYRHNKDQVFLDLKQKLVEFFNSFQAPSPKKAKNSKKEVIIPQKIIAATSPTSPLVSKSKPRTFKK